MSADDDREHVATLPMYRAALSNYDSFGAAGCYLGTEALRWPRGEDDYSVLRELGNHHHQHHESP